EGSPAHHGGQGNGSWLACTSARTWSMMVIDRAANTGRGSISPAGAGAPRRALPVRSGGDSGRRWCRETLRGVVGTVWAPRSGGQVQQPDRVPLPTARPPFIQVRALGAEGGVVAVSRV